MNKFYILISATLILLLGMFVISLSNSAAPGDILYSLDRGLEDLQVTVAGITGGSLAKAETYLLLAEERLDEIVALSGEGYPSTAFTLIREVNAQSDKEIEKRPEIDQLSDDYEKNINKAVDEAKEAQEKGNKNADKVLEKVTESTLKHQEKLLEVYERVPEQAKESILKAMEKSNNGHKRALDNISIEKRGEVEQKIKDKKEEIQQKIEEKRQAAQPKRDEEKGSRPIDGSDEVDETDGQDTEE